MGAWERGGQRGGLVSSARGQSARGGDALVADKVQLLQLVFLAQQLLRQRVLQLLRREEQVVLQLRGWVEHVDVEATLVVAPLDSQHTLVAADLGECR